GGTGADPAWAASAVSSVSNSDGTLTISPTTGAVVASLALGHANTWTATQTFVGVGIGTSTFGTVAKLTVNPSITPDNAATVQVTAAHDADTCLTLQGHSATQSGPHIDIQRSDGTSGLQISSGASTVTLNAPSSNINIAGYSISLNTAYGYGLTFFYYNGLLQFNNAACQLSWNNNSGIGTVTGGVLKITDASTGLGWLVTAGRARNTADVTNATVTFTNLSDLTITLIAGRKYTGRATIKCNNSQAAEGVQLD